MRLERSEQPHIAIFFSFRTVVDLQPVGPETNIITSRKHPISIWLNSRLNTHDLGCRPKSATHNPIVDPGPKTQPCVQRITKLNILHINNFWH
jgi:hypothetical protein